MHGSGLGRSASRGEEGQSGRCKVLLETGRWRRHRGSGENHIGVKGVAENSQMVSRRIAYEVQ